MKSTIECVVAKQIPQLMYWFVYSNAINDNKIKKLKGIRSHTVVTTTFKRFKLNNLGIC